MAKKETNNTETIENKIEVDEEKESLKKQVEILQKQLESFNEKFEELTKKEENKVVKNETEDYFEVNPNKRIKVMNMVHAPGTYTNGKTSVRFEHFGDVRHIRYEDLEDFRFGVYNSIFENVELRILDKDVVKALNLDNFYAKNDVSKENMEKILGLEVDDMMYKIKTLAQPLQVSFASLFIEEYLKNNPNCANQYKIQAISDYFKINNFQDIVTRARG